LKRDAVVYFHGLWMTGREALLLRRRLTVEHGYDWHGFRYHCLTATMREHVERCARFIAGIDAPRIHLVGHSLGGLVIYRLLESGLIERPERLGHVVFLGTPSVESRTGRRFGAWSIGRRLLGPAAQAEFLQAHARRWDFAPPLGIIAGNRPIGLGRAISAYDIANDGTVAVEETRLPGATGHVVLPVSHSGMWTSARVARSLAQFLAQGRFEP
jgi:pimeloyl-ACP methyl ester carboxylesterase